MYYLKDSLNCVSNYNKFIYNNICMDECNHTLYIKINTKEYIDKCDILFHYLILNEDIGLSKCLNKYPFIIDNKYCSKIDKKENYIGYKILNSIFIFHYHFYSNNFNYSIIH
jgi:hypothetical protein